ncbi:MAG TPA: glycosyltransferase family A protein [Pirellulales bacterium]|jgi:glycosyltransferase involved in cell wall biosynthesis
MTEHAPHSKSQTPTISIVLPTHNGSRYIDQSIMSVVRQTWQDWEMIVVNDASTDSTATIVNRWTNRDPRITAIHLSKNRTLPGALNDGFAFAKGEFHTWTSDDNWYHPRALAEMLAVLRQTPSVSVVCTDRTNVNQYGTPIEVSEAGSADDLHIMNRIGACFLYRREVTTALNGYDENLFGAEDYDFWLRASLRFRFTRVAQPLYFYRLQPGSLSARKFALIAKNVEAAVRRWLPQVNWRNDNVRSQAYSEWGVRCLRAGTWENIFEPWLHKAQWLDTDARALMRRTVLKRSTQLAWEAHWRRDWQAYDRFKQYMLEVGDDPAVARLLARRVYPRWIYRVKDQLRAARDNAARCMPESWRAPPPRQSCAQVDMQG